jgi:hypothetical protein
MIRRRERVMAVLWPSFLMAGVMEMLVFAFVDPGQLQLFGGRPIDWSPSAVYTLAFFVFWVVIAAAAALTELLEVGADELNATNNSPR